MKKFLYFSAGTPDGTASTEEVVCFPADQLSHMELATATQLRVYFESSQENDADSGIDAAHAVLTITTGKHKEVMGALAAIINGGPHSDGFVVVADSENSVFAHANITACASIAVVDAS